MSEYILGVTGASGALYAVRTARALLELGHTLRLVATESGGRVLEYETGRTLEAWAGRHPACRLEDNRDLFSAIASGTHTSAGMVIAPCSMSTIGRLAGGVTNDLLARAADVTLKQRRPLVLVPRETPLTVIHLENLLRLARAGAWIVPAMPGFYTHPGSVPELADFMAGRVLDCLGVEHSLYRRWDGPEKTDGKDEPNYETGL